MKKAILIPLIIGGVLLTAGTVLFIVGFSASNQSIERVSKTYDLDDPFTNFDIRLETSNLEFKVSEDGKKKVVCEETSKYYHGVQVQDGTLKIASVDTRAWYEKFFDFNLYFMKTTVYLPADNYGSLNVHSATGDIVIPENFVFTGLSAELSTGNITLQADVQETLKAKSSTGRITIENVEAKNFDVSSSTGDVMIRNSLAQEQMRVHTSVGDISIMDSDASTLDVEASTGDIDMALLSGKTFDVSTSTGRQQVPASTPGAGSCRVHTSTGNITIRVNN